MSGDPEVDVEVAVGDGEGPPPGSPVVVGRILDVLLEDVVPLTEAGVAAGNKIFGAAIVDRVSLDLVIAATNGETDNPLLHGEVSVLNSYWALPPGDRPPPEDCLFVSTHEPCSMCLSAITWSGFDNFFYLFSYEDSRDAFNIPHDLKILAEVFAIPDGGYNRSNAFWSAYSLPDLASALPGEAGERARAKLRHLRDRYGELSEAYQTTKDSNEIPLS